MTSVGGPSMTGRQSMTRVLTLSIPGGLFEAMRLTCPQETGENLNNVGESGWYPVDVDGVSVVV